MSILDTHRIVALDVCTDCLMMLANGDCGDCHRYQVGPNHYRLTDQPCPTGVRLARRWAGIHVHPDTCPADCDSSYVTSPCDGCGSADHGARHSAVAWVPHGRVVAEVRRLRPDGATVVVRAVAEGGAVVVVAVIRRRGRPTLVRHYGGSYRGGRGRYADAAQWLRATLSWP